MIIRDLEEGDVFYRVVGTYGNVLPTALILEAKGDLLSTARVPIRGIVITIPSELRCMKVGTTGDNHGND